MIEKQKPGAVPSAPIAASTMLGEGGWLIRDCQTFKTYTMIRKIEHQQNMYTLSFDAGYKKTHIERHLVTTWYFLFIPIYRSKIYLSSNL